MCLLIDQCSPEATPFSGDDEGVAGGVGGLMVAPLLLSLPSGCNSIVNSSVFGLTQGGFD